MAKDCADRFRIGRARLASLIDTASCIVQGFQPYGGPILIAIGVGRATGLSLAPGDVICALYYPPVLAAAVFASMFLRRRRRGGKLSISRQVMGVSSGCERVLRRGASGFRRSRL